MKPLKVIDHYEIPGRGTVFNIALDKDCNDFSELINQEIALEGLGHFICIGVERFLHAPPWRKSEIVGLLVKPLKKGGVE